MGLHTWTDAPHGKIQKFDVVVAKNYLAESEFAQLSRLVNAYLDVAEDMALRRIPMTMQDWETRLNRFLAATDRAAAKGACFAPQVAARPTGLLMGLQSTAHPFLLHAGYREIAPLPLADPLAENLSAEALLKVGDNITTDHILPAGADIVRFRSNIPTLSDFVFFRLDEGFAARAKARGGGFIVGGENYGQGSSREHAAIAPMFLGVTGVLAKSFARIHQANLINWGLIPMTFAYPADYDVVETGDILEIPRVRDIIARGSVELIVKNVTKAREIPVRVELNERERAYILSGGKLAHTKLHPVV
jgi:3-isopropylmalate dehydratase small subunit